MLALTLPDLCPPLIRRMNRGASSAAALALHMRNALLHNTICEICLPIDGFDLIASSSCSTRKRSEHLFEASVCLLEALSKSKASKPNRLIVPMEAKP